MQTPPVSSINANIFSCTHLPQTHIYFFLFGQVICDFDLIFWNCIAKWPGSMHDARILRECDLFPQFDGTNRPLRGFILGDSGYMQRDWLMVPVANPDTEAKIRYNYIHSSARTAVERAIGVLKRRWHCLRELRLEPAKACKVCCFIF